MQGLYKDCAYFSVNSLLSCFEIGAGFHVQHESVCSLVIDMARCRATRVQLPDTFCVDLVTVKFPLKCSTFPRSFVFTIWLI
jgi:hypothetical protein